MILYLKPAVTIETTFVSVVDAEFSDDLVGSCALIRFMDLRGVTVGIRAQVHCPRVPCWVVGFYLELRNACEDLLVMIQRLPFS